MPTTMVQFLYLSNVFGNPTEIINGARTSARLRTSEMCANGTFNNIIDDGGCDVLRAVPCTMAADGSVSDWEPINLTDGSDPWYTGSAASSEAFGFWIEDWTGIDGAHHGRSVTGVGMNRGGAYFGPQSHGHRVMKLNVQLLAASERGLNHLFRWLENTLLRACDPCSFPSMWVREFCPNDPASDPAEGMARLSRIALLEGPTWEAPLSDRSGCNIRRASFTIAAGDPCMYRSSVSCVDAEAASYVDAASPSNTAVAPDGFWTPGNSGVSCTVPAPTGGYGQVAPRVTITSAYGASTSTGVRNYLPDLRIAGYSNPAGGNIYGSDAVKIGEFVLTGRGTAGLEIVVDLAERIVKYREANGPWQNWLDGSRLIGQSPDPGARRWWSFNDCDDGVVLVEPVYLSQYNSAVAAALGASTPAWTVSIDTVTRFGCT